MVTMMPDRCSTIIHEGGAPIKYKPGGKEIEIPSAPREARVYNGRGYILEEAITGEWRSSSPTGIGSAAAASRLSVLCCCCCCC